MNSAILVSAVTFLLVSLVGCESSNPSSVTQASGTSDRPGPSASTERVSQASNGENTSAEPSETAPAQHAEPQAETGQDTPVESSEPWEPHTDWEKSLVAEVLVDVRGGVELYGDEAFGLCRKGENNACGEYLGPTPGTLEPGEYFVFAQVQAPALADGWKVVYTSNCGLTSGGGTAARSESKERTYPVKYKSRRAYPVRMPSVVAPGGSTDSVCEISLDSLSPGGERQRIGEGQFVVPAG